MVIHCPICNAELNAKHTKICSIYCFNCSIFNINISSTYIHLSHNKIRYLAICVNNYEDINVDIDYNQYYYFYVQDDQLDFQRKNNFLMYLLPNFVKHLQNNSLSQFIENYNLLR